LNVIFIFYEGGGGKLGLLNVIFVFYEGGGGGGKLKVLAFYCFC
jgi:hypothetical protein